MDIEGCVQVAVDLDGNRIGGVRVDSTRTDFAQALMAGRKTGEAQALLPRLFSICARAQAAAASAALSAAREADQEDLRRSEMAVLAEVAVEYLWRFRIDLPGLLGLPQRREALARLRRELSQATAPDEDRNTGAKQGWTAFIGTLRSAVHEECCGENRRVECAAPEDFAAWEARSDSSAARLLRAVRAVPLRSAGTALLPGASEALLREIGDALERDSGFSRRPEFAGAPAECGALARLAGHPLVRAAEGHPTSRAYRRVLARMLELIRIPERLAGLLRSEEPKGWVRSLSLGPGRGIAGVETARGLLVHAVRLEGDRVIGYRIVAPTEWNFHPCGALFADLSDVSAPTQEEIKQHAALAIQSLDPCVRYTLEIKRLRNA